MAAAAVQAHPEMSDRAIAAKVGVASNTVRAARQATEQDCPVEPRIGLDGKTRRVPTPKAPRDPLQIDPLDGLGGGPGHLVDTSVSTEPRQVKKNGTPSPRRSSPQVDIRQPHVLERVLSSTWCVVCVTDVYWV
jgi:hypothetical protein